MSGSQRNLQVVEGDLLSQCDCQLLEGVQVVVHAAEIKDPR